MARPHWGAVGEGVWGHDVPFRLLHRPNVIGLLVVAIAAFWPLFAGLDGDGSLVLHLLLFAIFCSTAIFSFRIGITGLAVVLFGHDLFDIAMFTTDHPGPLWWPAFCAGYDVVLALILLVPFHFGRSV